MDRTASAATGRGKAYSISVKRTRRGEAKMRSERSTRALVPDRRVTRRLSDGIARGNARPMTHASWKARLASRMSSTHARHCGRGRGDSSTASLVRVSALSACGKTKNSKWRCPSTCSSSPSRTSASAIGASTPRSVKAGTACSVTSVTTPSAPTATRAASSSSPSAMSTTSPDPLTRRSPRTCAERLRSVAPVPCVAVEIAPAIDCSSMSPRLGSASPCSASASLRACRRMPASTRTTPLPGSASSSAPMRSRLSRVPSVSTAAVKE